jgi:flagellar biosynthesis/type III secretory pathway protein FliH
MAESLHASQRPRIVSTLFDEDFDVRLVAPEPEVIEPVFSAGELASARDAAWREGQAAGLQEAAASEAASTQQALEAIAGQIKANHDEAVALAEQTADGIARLLLDSLAAVFPALCSHYGEAEVCAIVRTVLPSLTQEPAITVRAHPHTAAALTPEIDNLDPDIAVRVQIVTCDAMPPGDVRVTWHNGSAVRDAAGLWDQVAAVLAPAGLLRADAKIMETVDGN